MPEAENHALPGATNDSWRSWLMTGARRTPIDRRRMRGAHKGLKKMLVEGMSNGDERPHAWKDFSGAMIRHAVDDAIRTLPTQDKQVVKLAYFGGYSNRAIAEETGLTEATVQRRLRRALATISDHIQHGRKLGRRAMYALLLWLTYRRLGDGLHHFVQAATVAGVTVIIATQPATPVHTALGGSTGQAEPVVVQPRVVPPLPSPTVPAQKSGTPPAAAAPAVPAVPALPALPAVPAVPTPQVKLPVALPSPSPLPLRS